MSDIKSNNEDNIKEEFRKSVNKVMLENGEEPVDWVRYDNDIDYNHDIDRDDELWDLYWKWVILKHL